MSDDQVLAALVADLNIIFHRLDLIHRQNNRILETLDRVVDELRALKVRTTSVEEALAGINRRLDRHEDRRERIERRLDLVDEI